METVVSIIYTSSSSKEHIGDFGDRGKKRHNKEQVLFDLLVSLRNEQNIIYCSSPNRVRYLAKTFAEYLKSINMETSQTIYPITEWVKINISDDWMLLRGLEFDIGIHDGALQKHITSSIIVEAVPSKQLIPQNAMNTVRSRSFYALYRKEL